MRSTQRLRRPEDVWRWAKSKGLPRLPREEMWALSLDRRDVLLAEERVGVGGIAGVTYVTSEVIETAKRPRGVVGFIVVHQHPSGDPHPAPADIAATATLFARARAAGIPLLDHVIVCEDRFCSLAREHLMEGREHVLRDV